MTWLLWFFTTAGRSSKVELATTDNYDLVAQMKRILSSVSSHPRSEKLIYSLESMQNLQSIETEYLNILLDFIPSARKRFYGFLESSSDFSSFTTLREIDSLKSLSSDIIDVTDYPDEEITVEE
jgi:hypothetical protein